MKERTRIAREHHGAPGGLGSIFDQPDPSGVGTVHVNCGLYDEHLPVANSTVSEIRARFQHRLEIAPGAGAVIDGREVADDTVVRMGQTLTFRHSVAIKGRHDGIAAARK